MDDVIQILQHAQLRAQSQIKDLAEGKIVVVGGSEPILDYLEYNHLLHAQLLDINEVVSLLLASNDAYKAITGITVCLDVPMRSRGTLPQNAGNKKK